MTTGMTSIRQALDHARAALRDIPEDHVASVLVADAIKDLEDAYASFAKVG